MMQRVAGRRLSGNVIGDDPDSQSLTDFFRLGEPRAARVLEHLGTRGAVLDVDGNVGQIARALAARVQRVVSVDADPAMAVYGPQLSPDVEFVDRSGLAADEVFDGAYWIGSIGSMTPDEQRATLEYTHARLFPGARFVVDLGRRDTTSGNGGRRAPAAPIDEFTNLVGSLFTWRRVPLIDVGLVLTKASGIESPTVEASARLRVNDESVVADILDGEVVVVNLESGAYYVLQGSAATIWQLFAGAMTTDEVVAALLGADGGDDDAEMIGSWVDDFRQQLLDEHLVVPAAGDTVVSGDLAVVPPTPIDPPVMFRYTDMQFLIQMDPIREYDESGWPVRRAAQVVRPSE